MESLAPHTVHDLLFVPEDVHVAVEDPHFPHECPLAQGSAVPPPSPASTAAALTIE